MTVKYCNISVISWRSVLLVD